MATQKLYKNGNSISMTVPKEYLKDLNLRDGSIIDVKMRGDEIVVKSKKSIKVADVDQKFAKMVDEFIHDHEDVLQKLSKR